MPDSGLGPGNTAAITDIDNLLELSVTFDLSSHTICMFLTLILVPTPTPMQDSTTHTFPTCLPLHMFSCPFPHLSLSCLIQTPIRHIPFPIVLFPAPVPPKMPANLLLPSCTISRDNPLPHICSSPLTPGQAISNPVMAASLVPSPSYLSSPIISPPTLTGPQTSSKLSKWGSLS